jgi:hypothetical protein
MQGLIFYTAVCELQPPPEKWRSLIENIGLICDF